MKNYHCPGFFSHQSYIYIINDLLNKYPYAFVDNTHIGSVYDAFPNMIWNGGGTNRGPFQDFERIKSIFEFYKDLKIPMKLTLTNPTLDKQDLSDKYCNSILNIASNYDNVEILISSSILENHIRTFFPHFQLNHSIIATEQDKTIDNYIQECKKYHHIVLPRRLGKNWDFLNQIPLELRSKFELLCTDPCPINCPNIYTHYKAIGNYQRGFDLDKSKIHCTHNFSSPFKYADYAQDQISLIEIANLYEPAGFTEFKLSGRSNITGPIAMIDYFFKPEYKRDAYAIVLENKIPK